MIKLPDVTLIALSSVKIPQTINAIEYSYCGIKFAEVKLVTDKEFLHVKIKREYCPPMNDISAYNEYCFLHLGDHIETSHALVIQHDGFVIRPYLWNDAWLQYDWIGAPWGIVENTYMANDGSRSRVGNGGFSLRSQKIMRIAKINNWQLRSEQGWANEDGNFCCYWKKEMLENGIKYAPVEVAAHFSFENDVPENIGIKSFGFHKNIRKEWLEELS